MSEKITEIILLVAPSIITILSMVGVIAKVISNFKALKKDVVDMKDITEIKSQLKCVLEENYELKKKLNETMTIIDRIERKE